MVCEFVAVSKMKRRAAVPRAPAAGVNLFGKRRGRRGFCEQLTQICTLTYTNFKMTNYVLEVNPRDRLARLATTYL